MHVHTAIRLKTPPVPYFSWQSDGWNHAGNLRPRLCYGCKQEEMALLPLHFPLMAKIGAAVCCNSVARKRGVETGRDLANALGLCACFNFVGLTSVNRTIACLCKLYV